jgi:hypothetical protein
VQLTDAEVGGGACSLPVRQRSAEHCTTLDEHLLGGLGARPSTLDEHMLGSLGSRVEHLWLA